MRWCSERGLATINGDPSSAAIGQAEAAYDLPVDSLRDPRYPSMVAVWHATIELALAVALRNKSYADHLLSWAALGSPRAALLAIARHVVFTRAGVPRLPSWAELARLHHPWLPLRKRHAPMEAIAAEVDVAATIRDIILGRVQHPFG